MIPPRPAPLARDLLRTRRASVAVALLGLGVTGALAGCSSATSTTGTDDDAGSSGSGSSGSGSSASYTDGTYTATGDYQSPGGSESIEVEVTLEDDAVTAITVTPQASGGNAERYQNAFASGISEKVVGKRIDELTDVTRVSGSSLTSAGFQKAISDIESQAEA